MYKIVAVSAPLRDNQLFQGTKGVLAFLGLTNLMYIFADGSRIPSLCLSALYFAQGVQGTVEGIVRIGDSLMSKVYGVGRAASNVSIAAGSLWAAFTLGSEDLSYKRLHEFLGNGGFGIGAVMGFMMEGLKCVLFYRDYSQIQKWLAANQIPEEVATGVVNTLSSLTCRRVALSSVNGVAYSLIIAGLWIQYQSSPTEEPSLSGDNTPDFSNSIIVQNVGYVMQNLGTVVSAAIATCCDTTGSIADLRRSVASLISSGSRHRLSISNEIDESQV